MEKIKVTHSIDSNLYLYPSSSLQHTIWDPWAKIAEPQGPRYRTDQNFVEYAGWSFIYGVRSSTGIQIFDLRFTKERIAYEISLQEAIAFYAGDTPASMQQSISILEVLHLLPGQKSSFETCEICQLLKSMEPRELHRQMVLLLFDSAHTTKVPLLLVLLLFCYFIFPAVWIYRSPK